MNEINSQVTKLLQTWINLLVPENPKERAKIAKKTGLNAETLRKIRNRSSISADTLFRLMLAHNMPKKSIAKFPFTSVSFLNDSLVEWIKFGARLSERERKSFIEISKIVKIQFGRYRRDKN